MDAPAAHRMHQLLHDHLFADVEFVCGSRTFLGHQALLALASPVFHREFLLMRQETKRGPAARLRFELKGCDPDAFGAFLQFCYTGVAEIRPDLAPHLQALAEYYAVPALAHVCAHPVLPPWPSAPSPPPDAAPHRNKSLTTEENELKECLLELHAGQACAKRKSGEQGTPPQAAEPTEPPKPAGDQGDCVLPPIKSLFMISDMQRHQPQEQQQQLPPQPQHHHGETVSSSHYVLREEGAYYYASATASSTTTAHQPASPSPKRRKLLDSHEARRDGDEDDEGSDGKPPNFSPVTHEEDPRIEPISNIEPSMGSSSDGDVPSPVFADASSAPSGDSLQHHHHHHVDSAGVGFSARAPGYVQRMRPCHHCKTMKERWITCPMTRTHRFCGSCMRRHFGMTFERAMSLASSRLLWPNGCPACELTCPCAACKRRKERIRQGKLVRRRRKNRASSEDEVMDNLCFQNEEFSSMVAAHRMMSTPIATS